MRSSDRRIATVRKIEEDPRKRHDTLPAPPPSGAEVEHDGDGDTIPTPPPESGVTDVVVIPPHRKVEIDGEQ